MNVIIEEDTAPPPALFDPIRSALVAYNHTQVPEDRLRSDYAITVRDEAAGDIVGGLWARCYYEWMFVQLLSVPETARGQGVGRDIMARAEAYARANELTGIWLDTFTFQARGFYEKLGFEVFGQIDDYPKGHSRLFLRKILRH